MDYKELLRKYIEHVGECEGTDFTNNRYRGDRHAPEFTDEEWVELRRLAGWSNP